MNSYERIANPFARDEALAADPGTTPDILDTIARKPVVRGWADDRHTQNVGFARENVAGNPNADPATLDWLADIDGDWVMISYLCKNPATPATVLRRLAGRPGALLEQIVQNTMVPAGLLREIVDAHPSNGVLFAALSNPVVDDAMFEHIVGLVDPRYITAIAAAHDARSCG